MAGIFDIGDLNKREKLLSKLEEINEYDGLLLIDTIINKYYDEKFIKDIIYHLSKNKKKYTYKIIDHIISKTSFNYKSNIDIIGTISHSSAKFGNINLIKYLIKNKLFTNENNKSGENAFVISIDQAEFNSSFDTVKLLFNSGYFDINSKNKYGFTPLMYAINSSYYDMDYYNEIIRFLLENGANVNLQNNSGATPLLEFLDRNVGPFPINSKQVEYIIDTVKLLLEYGADINLTENIQGLTPLMVASTYCFDDKDNKMNVIKFLLDNGADIYIKDKQGYDIFNNISGECENFIKKYKNL